MLGKTGHIKNPLTVISIFAAIAEISGTSVLPFIEQSNQSTYIWFLMLFPFFLVGIFFLTLNFNHKALYAPSDYKNEKNFLAPLERPATPELQGQKLRDEIEEIKQDAAQPVQAATDHDPAKIGTPEHKTIADTPGSDSKLSSTENIHIKETQAPYKVKFEFKKDSLINDINLAERLSIAKVSRYIEKELKPNQYLLFPDGTSSIVFDGFTMDRYEAHALEVKIFKSDFIDIKRFIPALKSFEEIADTFKDSSKSFTIHLMLVLDSLPLDENKLRTDLRHLADLYDIKVKVYISTLNDLMNEFQYS
ncbi:hypothetical protein [Pseudomonas chlororaphis]|nr:hypothetical protein [Pseudomonas chlororaphis]